MTSQLSNRRGALGLFMGVSTVAALAQDREHGAPLPPRALLDISDFGATGDGVVDDTPAFVAALAASGRGNHEHNGVAIPPGTYRVDGPVVIRPGQSLIGSGYATLIDGSKATGPVFVCSTVGQLNTGGPPVEIRALRGLGGAGNTGFIEVHVAGFALSDIFLSAPGVGIHINGAADGIVTNIQIDQGLNGLVVHNAQNIAMSSILMFNVRFGITLSGNCADIGLSGSQISYAQYASILAADGARVRNLTVNGCIFTSNEQRESFIGHIHCRAREVSGAFNACAFRNWRGFAIRQSVGADAHLDFSNCSFDGLRSNTVYNQSLDASVIECGADGVYSFSSCQFRNLKGPLVLLRSGAGAVKVFGGSVDRSHPTLVTNEAAERTRLTIDRLDGIARGELSAVELPIWPTWSGWRLNITGHTSKQGRFDCEMVILPSNSGEAFTRTIWCSAANSTPIPALIVDDTLRVDFAKYDLKLIEASASSLP